MIISQLIDHISSQLAQRYDNPDLCHQYAWWMVQALTEKSKAQLIAEKEITLTGQQQKTLDIWIQKLIQENIPLQYLLGSVPFGQLTIIVEPPILIPRPETEEWVYELINNLTQLNNKQLNILDIGTGTGCIGLALAQALPSNTVIAVDTSSDALALAQKNAQHNKISNITFVHSDLFANIPKKTTFDLIVSNPPYIDEEEWKSLDRSVREWEDKQALVAHDKGLALIKEIIQQAPNYLQVNNALQDNNINQLYIEVGHQQTKQVMALMSKAGYTNIQISKDLFNKERVVSGRYDVAL